MWTAKAAGIAPVPRRLWRPGELSRCILTRNRLRAEAATIEPAPGRTYQFLFRSHGSVLPACRTIQVQLQTPGPAQSVGEAIARCVQFHEVVVLLGEAHCLSRLAADKVGGGLAERSNKSAEMGCNVCGRGISEVQAGRTPRLASAVASKPCDKEKAMQTIFSENNATHVLSMEKRRKKHQKRHLVPFRGVAVVGDQRLQTSPVARSQASPSASSAARFLPVAWARASGSAGLAKENPKAASMGGYPKIPFKKEVPFNERVRFLNTSRRTTATHR